MPEAESKAKRTPSENAIHQAIAALSRLNPDNLDKFATDLWTKKPRTAQCVLDALVAGKPQLM